MLVSRMISLLENKMWREEDLWYLYHQVAQDSAAFRAWCDRKSLDQDQPCKGRQRQER